MGGKRARAFAAELLLPRDLINAYLLTHLMLTDISSQLDAVDTAIENASSHFDVSTSLIIHQLYNYRSAEFSTEVRKKIKGLHVHYARETRLA